MLLDADDVSVWEVTRAGDSQLILTWPDHLGDAPTNTVQIRARASLQHLVHHWTFDAGRLDSSGQLVVLPEIPPEAQLDPVVEDYVVDLNLVAVIGGQEVALDPVWLAWPDGLESAPVLWTPEQGQTRAPFGVLHTELQDLAIDQGITARLLPPIGSPTARPPRDEPTQIDHAVDTGLYASGGAP